jgi:hypothetical protein
MTGRKLALAAGSGKVGKLSDLEQQGQIVAGGCGQQRK